ncbi:MAG: hypothetical protein PHE27_01485, partial [Alphaproteobacteria bacterium]|nr:hypothetical protein [Alphaproteobacteria bacterium]
MTITEDELSKLLEFPVEIDNRVGLPGEDRFASGLYGCFSEEERNKRDEAANQRHPNYGRIARSY